MKSGSLPPLSRKAELLLSAERDIVPQPELARRRAQLRARTSLWQGSQGREAGGISLFWKRLSLVAAFALVATSGLAAWFAMGPERPEQTPGVAIDAATVNPTPPRVLIPNSAAPKTRAAENPALQPEPAKQDGAAPATVTKRPVASSPRSSSKPNRTGAREELALLDQARRAVVGGNFRSALALLSRHSRSFPNSQLAEEREALRVRALKGAGLAKQAGQAASDFEERYPNSVLAPQMNESARTPR